GRGCARALRRARSLPARRLRASQIPARLLRPHQRLAVSNVLPRPPARLQELPRVAEVARTFDIFHLPSRALLPEGSRFRLLAPAEGLDSSARLRRDGLELLPPARRLLLGPALERLRASELRRAGAQPEGEGLSAGQLPNPARDHLRGAQEGLNETQPRLAEADFALRGGPGSPVRAVGRLRGPR